MISDRSASSLASIFGFGLQIILSSIEVFSCLTRFYEVFAHCVVANCQPHGAPTTNLAPMQVPGALYQSTWAVRKSHLNMS